MRFALDKLNRLREADINAPRTATCPECGGAMVLRQRRGTQQYVVTFFWRHQDHSNLSCPGRFHTGKRVRRTADS